MTVWGKLNEHFASLFLTSYSMKQPVVVHSRLHLMVTRSGCRTPETIQFRQRQPIKFTCYRLTPICAALNSAWIGVSNVNVFFKVVTNLCSGWHLFLRCSNKVAAFKTSTFPLVLYEGLSHLAIAINNCPTRFYHTVCLPRPDIPHGYSIEFMLSEGFVCPRHHWESACITSPRVAAWIKE